MLVGHLPHLAPPGRRARRRRGARADPLRPGDGRGAPARAGGRLGAGADRPAARRSGALMPHLVCVRCGATTPLGPAFEGCVTCAGEPRPALEVVYDYAALAAAGTLKAWASRPGGLWRFREVLPPPAGRVDPEPGGGRDPPGPAAGARRPPDLAEGRDAEPDRVLQGPPPRRVPHDGARARLPEGRRVDDGEPRHGARGLRRAGRHRARSCSAIPGPRSSSGG